ncbi:MAG: methionyl-tRNA formyltransferase [Acidobacteria bacterium]|nr:MAG: methionyl-tRNA formyltransferase [Acidobacteriota bacterium]
MSQSLNLVFCGTPPFAVPTLEALVEAGFRVQLVVTQPDKPRGRGMELAPSPVKQRALELGLPVIQPDKIKNNEEFRSRLSILKPESIVVVGYGRLIPQWMIDLPPLGNINLHASLLPKYRGAAPIQWAIACGETVTGVTTMKIDSGLDTGDILLQQEIPIGQKDTAVTIAPQMASMGAELMSDTLQGLRAGTVHSTPQDNSKASLAPILKKEDGEIDFHRSAVEIYDRLRGFQPWPGAYTNFRGKNLQVWNAKPLQRAMKEAELALETHRLIVGCGTGTALELLAVQPEGKKRMAARDFVHGYRPQSGERLGAKDISPQSTRN